MEVIKCQNCEHQFKYFHKDKRYKNGGYWIYSCKLNDDPFVAHVVNGYPDQYCSMAKKRVDI